MSQAARRSLEGADVRWRDQVFEVRLEDGRLTTGQRSATRPDAVMTMDVETLNALLRQGLAPAEALATKRVILEGDPKALDRFSEMFAHPGRGEIGAKRSLVARQNH